MAEFLGSRSAIAVVGAHSDSAVVVVVLAGSHAAAAAAVGASSWLALIVLVQAVVPGPQSEIGTGTGTEVEEADSQAATVADSLSEASSHAVAGAGSHLVLEEAGTGSYSVVVADSHAVDSSAEAAVTVASAVPAGLAASNSGHAPKTACGACRAHVEKRTCQVLPFSDLRERGLFLKMIIVEMWIIDLWGTSSSIPGCIGVEL